MRGQEVTFLIKKSLSGRIGWKIMPEDEKLNIKINKACVEQVMERIRWAGFFIIIFFFYKLSNLFNFRDLQFSGETVRSEMTIVIE